MKATVFPPGKRRMYLLAVNEIPEDVDVSGLCVDCCTSGVRGWCDKVRSQQEVTKTRTLKNSSRLTVRPRETREQVDAL